MTHPLTAPLIEKRRQVGAATPEGRRYSNLIGQIENVETVAEPWRRSNLLAGIQRTLPRSPRSGATAASTSTRTTCCVISRERVASMPTIRKSDMKVMDDLFIEIGQGPICPLCRWWGFDDWWHSNSCRDGSPPVRLHADLRCEECDITFEVTQYTDGETHSSYRRPTNTAAPAVPVTE